MNPDPCSLAPLSLNATFNGVQTRSIAVTGTGSYQLSLYTYNPGTYPSCYNFEFYEND